MNTIQPIPDGFNTINVYLVVPNSMEAVDFYQKAFGAELVSRMAGPDGVSTLHAELRLGNSTFMLADENEHYGLKSPISLGGSGASLHIYVPDADAVFNQAVAAGCDVQFPIDDAFWGDRYAKVRDPFGHDWGIATHKEDLTSEQLEQRRDEFFETFEA